LEGLTIGKESSEIFMQLKIY